MSRLPVLLAWSSGKDSAWTLHALRQRSDVEVVGLRSACAGGEVVERDGFVFADLLPEVEEAQHAR